MSMYTTGCAVGGDVEKRADNRLAAANVGIQSAIKDAVKDFNTHPAMTAVQFETYLDKAVRYGKAKQKEGKGVTRGLGLAIDAAEKAKAFWHPRATQMYVFKRGKNKEWQDTLNTVMRVYVEAAGQAAEVIKVAQAKEQLTTDVNPTNPVNLTKFALIGAAVFFGYRFIVKQKSKLLTNEPESENKEA